MIGYSKENEERIMDEAIEQRWRELSKKVHRELEEWRQQHPNATIPEMVETVREHLTGMDLPFEGGHLPAGGKWVVVDDCSQGTNRIASKRPEKTDGFPLREDFSLPLWERIRAWCQYANWFGPDWFDGASPSDPRAGFLFPPATEEQLHQTEQRMGYPHPPLLRALYLHVANGGFGPWEGLIGTPGGFSETLHARDPRYDHVIQEELIKVYGEAFCRESYPRLFDPLPFDLQEREKKSDDPRLIGLAEREWPTSFVNLCRGQEEEGFYVHARSGCVYLAGNAWNQEKTLTGEPATTLLHLQADSLEEWFERWLAGELESRYYSEEPEPRERDGLVDWTADEFDPFLDDD